MERVAQKFKNFKEAEAWEIEYHISMKPEERFAIADALKKKVYGDQIPDVRASYGRK
ncbi:hypothetical protein MUP95_05235 [bacterium]|nr:hypothetical protein [bacterium]